MDKPLVSICIPTYNGQKFLEACLESAIGQTYPNVEIIIVDDCSTDSTWEMVGKYAAKYSAIKVYRNEKNVGLVSNWNRCVELSTGEWIKFLFQDDTFDTDCIEVMINAISDDSKIIASGRRRILDESVDETAAQYAVDNTLTFEKLGIVSEVPVFISPEKIASLAAKNICINFIGEPTVVMFKKEIVKEFGFFNPDLIQICDLEYFLRIACNYGIKYVPKPLTHFRVHGGSVSAANTTAKIFSTNYIDPVIMAYELLYGTFFAHFREALATSQKIKLKAFFIIRTKESYKNALQSTPQNRDAFEAMERKYPTLSKFKKGTTATTILLAFIKLRRLFRN